MADDRGLGWMTVDGARFPITDTTTTRDTIARLTTCRADVDGPRTLPQQTTVKVEPAPPGVHCEVTLDFGGPLVLGPGDVVSIRTEAREGCEPRATLIPVRVVRAPGW